MTDNTFNADETLAVESCCGPDCCDSGKLKVSDTTDIHTTLQEHYGSIAENRSSCCGDDAAHAESLYDSDSLEDLPFDVTGLSLGCGDPVSIASLQPGETVLDLGSGGGIDCFMAARQVGESGHVIGVDMTPSMLEKANANKAKMGIENVEFRKGQIEDLPVDDNSINIIMSNCVINLAPDKSAVFSEAFRVLKPGGRMSISDIVTEGDFSEAMRADATKWAGCVSGAIDVRDYTQLMKDVGFVDVEVVDKVDSDERGVVVDPQEGIPRIFSARITAYKPA